MMNCPPGIATNGVWATAVISMVFSVAKVVSVISFNAAEAPSEGIGWETLLMMEPSTSEPDNTALADFWTARAWLITDWTFQSAQMVRLDRV